MSRDENSIGKNIKRIREAAGMTQKSLAKEMGTSQQAVANYEAGRRKPKIKTLVRFGNALNVPTTVLLASMLENDADLMNQTFTRGYQAGYEAAKKEVFEHMQAFLKTDAK